MAAVTYIEAHLKVVYASYEGVLAVVLHLVAEHLLRLLFLLVDSHCGARLCRIGSICRHGTLLGAHGGLRLGSSCLSHFLLLYTFINGNLNSNYVSSNIF